MKVLRSDNDREYCNNPTKRLLESKGIKLETTAPYTPQKNGKAEHANRTIVESARTMMLRANAPTFLSAEGVSTAVYLLNKTASSTTCDSTPFEIWTGQMPDYSHLKVFGSSAFVHIPKQFRTKLDEKSVKVVFVGYQGDSTNYRFYNPATRKMTESREAVFLEDQVGEVLEDPEKSSKYMKIRLRTQPSKDKQGQASEKETGTPQVIAPSSPQVEGGFRTAPSSPQTPDKSQPPTLPRQAERGHRSELYSPSEAASQSPAAPSTQQAVEKVTETCVSPFPSENKRTR